MTTPLLKRELLVVTGKGGTGKTTTAAILALLAARRGLRVIVVELAQRGRLAALFGRDAAEIASERALAERLWGISIDSDRALLEWMQALGGPISGRLLASSSTFQYFTAAAPGARELISMVKVCELTQQERWRRRSDSYDLVVLDAPATGHALALLRAPWTFGAIARVGPIAGETRRVRELLQDPARSGYVAVAHPSELGVSEASELRDGLREQIGRQLDAVIVNGMLPRRFSAGEMARIAALYPADTAPIAPSMARAHGLSELTRAAVRAASSLDTRARVQRNELARLRRRGTPTLTLPFLFVADLGLAEVERLADRLARRL
jgi:anion-transporting  ArsA/GET3 family ATPase